MMNGQSLIMSPSIEHKFRDKKAVSLCEEYKIDLQQATSKPISCTCFCPFEDAFDILACSMHERVFIYRVLFEDVPGSESKFSYQFIHDYICGSKCSTLAIGSKTRFVLPNEGFISLAVATQDFTIMVLNQMISSDSEEAAQQHFFTGHINHINDMAFEPITGEQLASTGDDCTCIVRSLTGEQNGEVDIKIMLTSPGMSVKWHQTEPNKLFVAEKKGLIRFYDTVSQMAVMSFDCNRYPLTASDWCFENSLFIGCAADKDLFFWDTSLTSLPIKVMKTNLEGLLEFTFYDSKLIAYRGRPNNFLSVKNFVTNQTYIEQELIAGRGMSWNRKIPLLAVGGPKFVHLYKFNVC